MKTPIASISNTLFSLHNNCFKFENYVYVLRNITKQLWIFWKISISKITNFLCRVTECGPTNPVIKSTYWDVSQRLVSSAFWRPRYFLKNSKPKWTFCMTKLIFLNRQSNLSNIWAIWTTWFSVYRCFVCIC